MNIGVIGGCGIVGSAVVYGLKKLNHKVIVHDIKLGTDIRDILHTEVCFICVPTPSKDTGECDTSIVRWCVKDLNDLKYNGIVVIKSTVSPGTTQDLSDNLNVTLCFVPEFLRERCAITDFTENHDVCIIGTCGNYFCGKSDDDVFRKLVEVHGHYPKKFVHTTATEAELTKYFNNAYNATLVTFANSFYELCKKLGVEYTNVKNAIVNKSHIKNIYLDCNDDFRGFGGMCLPKDTKELAYLCDKLGLNVEFFKMILKENDKYKTTVFDNMRLK